MTFLGFLDGGLPGMRNMRRIEILITGCASSVVGILMLFSERRVYNDLVINRKKLIKIRIYTYLDFKGKMLIPYLVQESAKVCHCS